MSYQVGRGGMLDGLDEALLGLSAGESTTFSSELVGGDLVGQAVEVEVTVSQVQEQELPEFDDEFAQLASEFDRSEEHTSELQSLMRNSYAVFCLKKKKQSALRKHSTTHHGPPV